MARISKPPEVRRQELLDTAMELFAEKGYEETSMADIAAAAGVVPGLCYRYFDSKQKLFAEAMDQYVKECCAAALPILHDRSRSIPQRLDALGELTLEIERGARSRAFYRRDMPHPHCSRSGEGRRGSRRHEEDGDQGAFFHRPENRHAHDRLNGKICAYLIPHVAQELRDACERGELRLSYPELTASYLLHAQVGLLGESEAPLEARVALIRRYTDLILASGC